MLSLLAYFFGKVWILKGRQILHSVKTKCVVCRRYDAKSAGEVVAPLPEGRVVHVRPFYFSGVDYAGPLLAKSQIELLKIWIVLFVCGTTRAVHLDVVTSLQRRMVSCISYDQTMQGLLGLRLKYCLSNGSLIRLVALGGEDFQNV